MRAPFEFGMDASHKPANILAATAMSETAKILVHCLLNPRPIFNATLRAAASWLFFRVARSTVMMQMAVLRSRLEKQPTDLRRSPRNLGDVH